jgi:omega-hydroxy-beta-dihydromenaquinone-9 sulfotransferase
VRDEPWMRSVQNHPLSGATLRQLLGCLRRGGGIDYSTFWPRLVFLLAIACVNSLFALLDTVLYSRAIAGTPLPRKPIFILGHPRTGTTLLHNLLALDKNHAYANTFDVGFASCFLSMERFSHRWPLNSVLSPTRPMDSLPLSWEVPGEDELAVNVLSGGASPYLAVSFLRRWREVLRCADAEWYGEWRDAFVYFCRKLQYKHMRGRSAFPQRLVLKSPVHTGRVATMLRLFPDAQFVFVHRHPEDVFASSMHMINTYYRPYAALQTFDAQTAQDYVLAQGRQLHAAYMSERAGLQRRGHGRLAEVGFENLVREPVKELRRVYGELELGEIDMERVRDHVRSISEFQRNAHQVLSAEAKELIRTEWADWYADFGYGDV